MKTLRYGGKAFGCALAQRLLDEAKSMQVDRIDLEILPTNKIAVIFWKSLGVENIWPNPIQPRPMT